MPGPVTAQLVIVAVFLGGMAVLLVHNRRANRRQLEKLTARRGRGPDAAH